MSGPQKPRRFPLGPLLPLLEARFPEPTEWNGGPMQKPATRCAATLGFSVGSAKKWAREGMTESTADRVACRLGYHPSAIWPEWFDTNEEESYAEAI